MYPNPPSLYSSSMISTPGQRDYINAGFPSDHATVTRAPFTYPMTTSPVEGTISQEASYVKTKQSQLYKTEYCRNWAELGECRYGKKCQYAHGEAELRKVARHSRYKTQICRAYHTEGTCLYGNRCTFIHDFNDLTKTTIGGNKFLVESSSMNGSGGEGAQLMKSGSATDVNGKMRQHSRFFAAKNVNSDHQVPTIHQSHPYPPLLSIPEAAPATSLQNKVIWNSKLGFGSPQPLTYAANLVSEKGIATSPLLTTVPTNTMTADDGHSTIWHQNVRPQPRSHSLPESSASMNLYSYHNNPYAGTVRICYNQQQQQQQQQHHINTSQYFYNINHFSNRSIGVNEEQ